MVDRSELTAALQDSLTGLATEWHFEIVSSFAFGMAVRGIPMTVACFALDGFDGHAQDGPAREAAVGGFGAVLRSAARQSDLPVRTSDDGFLCLLVDCNLPGGMVFADRLRDQAADFSAETGHTVSVGLATYAEGMNDAEELRGAGDRALDAAVAAGGDCVKIPQDLP